MHSKLCGFASVLTLATIVLLGDANQAAATIVGTDNASQADYDPPGNWENGDDGAASGNAFNAWTLTNQGGSSGHFIGSSTSLSGPGADINTSGESFGMFGHSGQQSQALRDLNGALSVGQVLSLDIAVNFRNGFKGVFIQDAGSTIFSFNIGGDDYSVSDALSNNGSIGNAYSSDTQFNLSFEQTTASGGNWTITRSGGIADSDTGTYSGTPTSLALYVNSTTGGSASEDNLFANNFSLAAVPEPSAFLFGGLICGLLVAKKLRKGSAKLANEVTH